MSSPEKVWGQSATIKKALGKLIEKKNEKVKTTFIPNTEEERAEQEKRREEERKARGNNGAKRNMHYEMTVEQKDVRPDDSIVGNPDAEEIGARQRWGRRQLRTPAGIFFPTCGRSSNHTHF